MSPRFCWEFLGCSAFWPLSQESLFHRLPNFRLSLWLSHTSLFLEAQAAQPFLAVNEKLSADFDQLFSQSFACILSFFFFFKKQKVLGRFRVGNSLWCFLERKQKREKNHPRFLFKVSFFLFFLSFLRTKAWLCGLLPNLPIVICANPVRSYHHGFFSSYPPFAKHIIPLFLQVCRNLIPHTACTRLLYGFRTCK